MTIARFGLSTISRLGAAMLSPMRLQSGETLRLYARGMKGRRECANAAVRTCDFAVMRRHTLQLAGVDRGNPLMSSKPALAPCDSSRHMHVARLFECHTSRNSTV